MGFVELQGVGGKLVGWGGVLMRFVTALANYKIKELYNYNIFGEFFSEIVV